MYKFLIIFVFLIITTDQLRAQDLILSQYAFYRDGINPASFTQDNDVNVFVLYNNQFSGFEHQPNTQIADVSLKLNDYKMGISAINDVIGFDKSQNIKLRLARKFAISEKSFFSLGLSAGVLNHKLEATKMIFEYGDDPVSYSDRGATRFDIDFGTEFQFDKLFLGLSVTHLGKEIKNPDYDSPVAHYYAYAQYAVKSNESFLFFPNLIMRYWKNTIYGELGLLAFYKNKVWLGANYSNHSDLAASAGLKITKNIYFGYSYKTNMNPKLLNPGITNTHEVFLNFAFNRKDGRIKSIRFID